MRAWVRAFLLRMVSAITGRHAALLAAQASREDRIFRLSAPYRVHGDMLHIHLLESGSGRLIATLIGYDGHFPTIARWRSEPFDYRGPSTFSFNLVTGDVAIDDRILGRSILPEGRRFCWRFQLATAGGEVSRLTGHYRPADGRPVDRSYFYGDDYLDYEAQSRGDAAVLLRLMREFHAEGPVLEIGCATGQLLAALAREHYDVAGVDFSEWAVEQASQALGPGRAFKADVEADGFPAPIVERAPFGIVIIWMVLEHFRDPFAVIASVRALMRPGSLLFIYTTNADSLSHHIFGDDWEGYFDWTHHGVDRVSAGSLREAFISPGWELLRLTTETFWAVNADPTVATAREWFDADARFRRLLSERDLGDFVLCLARRR
jgi:SAM-dependent methyltransferase